MPHPKNDFEKKMKVELEGLGIQRITRTTLLQWRFNGIGYVLRLSFGSQKCSGQKYYLNPDHGQRRVGIDT